jgi:hypothetical protein
MRCDHSRPDHQWPYTVRPLMHDAAVVNLLMLAQHAELLLPEPC